MSKNVEEDFSFLSDYSIKELEDLKKLAEKKQLELMDEWAFKLHQILTEDGFDPYSRKGEKRLEKFRAEQAEKLAGSMDYIDLIDEELATRDGYVFPKEDNYKYSIDNYENLTTEEFLALEKQKIDQARKDLVIQDDDYDD